MTKRNTKEQILQGGKGASTTTSAATGTTAPSTPLAQNRVPSLGAANPELTPVKDLTQPATSVGGNWAADPQGNDKTLSYEQMKEYGKFGTISGKDQSNPNAGIGGTKTNVKLSDDKKNAGVYAGSPDALESAHTLADIKKRWDKNEEDLATLEKRKKRNALFSAIGDGVSALANLYFTTKGSPSADQSNTMSRATQEAYDKERAILEHHRDKLLDSKARALAQERDNWYKNQELKIKQEMAEAKKAYNEALTKAQMKRAEDYMNYLAERNNILREEKEADSKRKDEELGIKKEVGKSTVYKNNATGAAASRNAASNEKKANAYSYNQYDAAKKRGSRAYNPANDPGMVKVVEKDRRTGSTRQYYQPKASTKSRTGNGQLGTNPNGL